MSKCRSYQCGKIINDSTYRKKNIVAPAAVIFCFILVVSVLFSGCILGKQLQSVTFHFYQVSGDPVVGAHVWTYNNSAETDAAGNVVFMLDPKLVYDLYVSYKGSVNEYSPIRSDNNYQTFYIGTSPICNIETWEANNNYGRWTFSGYANNTGGSGNCKITAKIFRGDFKSVPVDSKTEVLFIQESDKKPFSIIVTDPENIARNYSISYDLSGGYYREYL